MATQALRPEIELVVDDTTTSNVISHSNHEPTSLMVAKRSLTSLNSILTKFHAGYFRISLSLGGQALWWKTLIESPTHDVTSALRRLLCTLPSSAFLALCAIRGAENTDVFGYVVGVRGAGGGAGREILRAGGSRK
ncbi:hypothetical protein JHK87_014104 [Glycine soja]|nr:hypothetical protein JHK87_014104 [Glycine soja]